MLFCMLFAMVGCFSIGSLGAGKSKDIVSGIKVNGAKIFGTKNGVRIKTWQVKNNLNINFENIEKVTIFWVYPCICREVQEVLAT